MLWPNKKTKISALLHLQTHVPSIQTQQIECKHPSRWHSVSRSHTPHGAWDRENKDSVHLEQTVKLLIRRNSTKLRGKNSMVKLLVREKKAVKS